MGETTPQITGLGRKWYDPKAFHANADTKVLYMSPNAGDKLIRTPYNNVSGLSPGSIRGEFVPPVITGPSGSAGDLITAISINENSTPIHIFSADETVTWSKSGADTSKFTLNTSTGQLVFASAPNYEVPTDADGNNIYQVVITATDTVGNASSQTVNVTVSDIDESPVLNSSTPADNATSVAVDSNIVLNFNKAVDAESGNIYIKKTSDNSTVQTIDVTSGAVSGSGSATITINPSSDLDHGVEYYVLIDATAFDAADSSSYAGISSTTALSFTTAITHVTSNLILHLDANNYSGSGDWLDETSEDHDGIISNATYVNDGDADYFDFDTDDLISIVPDESSDYPNDVAGFPSRRLFSGQLDFSMSIWFKTHTFPASTSYTISPIIFRGGRRLIQLVHGDSGAVDKISLRLKTSSWQNFCESPTLSLNTWYNYTVTWDVDGDVRGYLNGSDSGISTASPATISFTSGQDWSAPVTLSPSAYWSRSGARSYDGQIALLSIYDKVLSSSEVTQNFNTFKSRYGY